MKKRKKNVEELRMRLYEAIEDENSTPERRNRYLSPVNRKNLNDFLENSRKRVFINPNNATIR